MREMVGRGMAWAMNGVAGTPEEPLFAFERGRTMRIRMVNNTSWPHGMHLHHHHFHHIHGGAPGPLHDRLP